MDATFLLLEYAAAQPRLLIDGSAVRALAALLVRVRFRYVLVAPDIPFHASVPRIHTAWMPRSCTSNDMKVASTPYELLQARRA